MLVSTTGERHYTSRYAERFDKELQKKNNSYKPERRYDDDGKQSCISSVASTNVSDNTARTMNTELFPQTASYVSSVYAKSDFGEAMEKSASRSNDDLFEQMQRLNLLAKYNNGVHIDRKRIIEEHGKDFVVFDVNNFITLKPKLKLPIPIGKFARWFQVVDPNATIRDDIKMARGVLRKDRFQHPTQLDNYLGIQQALEAARQQQRKAAAQEADDKEQKTQYRVKRVRNKLKHWNAMYKQLHDAIHSVDLSNYTMREKVQHVDQICSIYCGRAERAIDCFYSEPAAHFMLDMVVTLQQKVAEARSINQSYQNALREKVIV